MKATLPLVPPLAVLLLSACSSALPSADGRSNAPQGGSGQEATRGVDDAEGDVTGDADGALASVDLVATGLDQPDEIVAHGGTAFISTRAGLVKVSPLGAIEKFDESPSPLATDGSSIVWLTSRAITSAPFAALGQRTVTNLGRAAMNLTAHGARAFVTLDPATGIGGPLLRAELGRVGAPQPVTTNVAMNYAGIAADGTHVYFFGPPNEDSVEVRRAPVGGGESERIGYVSTGHGSAIVLTDTMVFFTAIAGSHSASGGLYALPKAGGVAPRSIFESSNVIASTDGIYFVARSDGFSRIYKANNKGENLRLLAQHYSDSTLTLAVDETGVFAVAPQEGALYKLSKK